MKTSERELWTAKYATDQPGSMRPTMPAPKKATGHRKRAKYGNTKCTYRGKSFDSKREMQYYMLLEFDESLGYIDNLKCQVKFMLLPSKGKEKAVHYIADFTYMKDGKLKVVDAKGLRTREYVLKRKLMNYIHGIEIEEV